MRYLFNDYKKLLQKIRKAKRVCILLDFDGTIAPIAQTPKEAQLVPEIRSLLQQLINFPKCRVAIVSGRSVKDLRNLIGIKNKIIYAGNHGLEWDIHGIYRIITLTGFMKRTLSEIAKKLNELIEIYPKAILQEKTVTLSLHYRLMSIHRVPPFLEEAQEILSPYQEQKLITLLNGKKALDIKPAIAWGKGDFARLLLERYEKDRPTVIYIGDDTTDEDAFKKLPHATTVSVGKKDKSDAKYYVESVQEVERFLGEICSALGKN